MSTDLGQNQPPVLERRGERTAAAGAQSPVLIKLLFAGFSLVVLALSMTLPMDGDYEKYAAQWQWILQGGNPWFRDNGEFTGNAYGPVHVLLTWVYGLHPLLPRTLFVAAWLGLATWTWRRLAESSEAVPRSLAVYLALFLFLNPFFWVFTLVYATHDTLVALSCVAAVVAVNRRRYALAGVSLAAGTMLKFIPIMMLPFLALSHRHEIRWSMIAGFLGTSAVGFGVAVAVWGPSVFEPLLFAAGRESKMLSIFFFLRGTWSPLRLWIPEPNLDSLSLPCMVIAYGLLALYYVRTRPPTMLIATLSLFVPFVFYKVGHQQFYCVLFFLIPAWVFSNVQGRQAQLHMLLRSTLPLVWISLTAFVYFVTRGYGPPFDWFRQTVGLPTFIFSVYGVSVMLRAGWFMSTQQPYRPSASTLREVQ